MPLDCAGEYRPNTVGYPNVWSTSIDLGVSFSEISSVYVDWSGELTGGVYRGDGGSSDPCEVVDGLFAAFLYEEEYYRFFSRAWQVGGESTYPEAEPFDVQSAFDEDWPELLDGQAKFHLGIGSTASFDMLVVKHAQGVIESATLVVEGTVVPEPGGFALVVGGAVGGWRRRRRRRG